MKKVPEGAFLSLPENSVFGDRLNRAVRDGIVDFGVIALGEGLSFAVVVKLEDRGMAPDAKAAADADVLINFSFFHGCSSSNGNIIGVKQQDDNRFPHRFS